MPDANQHATEKSDLLLLRAISKPDRDPAGSRQALADFYIRHVEDLHRFCSQFRNRLGGDPGVQDLVEDTFIRAAQRAHTFKADELAEPLTLYPRTRSWLQRIATRLFLDRQSESERLREALEKQAEEENREKIHGRLIFEPEPEERRKPATPLALRARAVLKSLKHRDRMILVLSLDWFDPEKRRFEPPSMVIREICRKYRISAENYRKIRSRAYKYCESELATTNLRKEVNA